MAWTKSVKSPWPGLAEVLAAAEPPPLPFWRLEKDAGDTRAPGTAATDVSLEGPPQLQLPQLAQAPAKLPRTAPALPSAYGKRQKQLSRAEAAYHRTWSAGGFKTWMAASRVQRPRPDAPASEVAMPPLPKWLHRELSRVKLPSYKVAAAHEQSTATLPSLDGSMSVTSAFYTEAELRQAFFLRQQLAGCAPVMRSDMEELWLQHLVFERERTQLRTAERRAMSMVQKAQVKSFRLRRWSRSGTQEQPHLQAPPQRPSMMSRPTSGSSRTSLRGRRSRTKLMQPGSESPAEARLRDLLPQGQRGSRQLRTRRSTLDKMPTEEGGEDSSAAKRTTVLRHLKHRSTLQERTLNLDRLRLQWEMSKIQSAGQGPLQAATNGGNNYSLRQPVDPEQSIDDLQTMSSTGSRRLAGVAGVLGSGNSSTDLGESLRSMETVHAQQELEVAFQLMPQVAAMRDAFYRYDYSGRGQLGERELRSALSDLGFLPSRPKEKRAAHQLMSEALAAAGKTGKMGFQAFIPLVPKMRAALHEATRVELEEWFARGLDEYGMYDMAHLRRCLEAFGVTDARGDDEWDEASAIFEGFQTAVGMCTELASQRTRSQRTNRKGIGMVNSGTAGAMKNIIDILEVATQGPEPLRAAVSSLTQFDLFEMLFHQAQERLTVMRRAKVRALAEELQLSDQRFEVLYSDLFELHRLFLQYDEDDSGILEEEEIARCLAVCGLQGKSRLSRRGLHGLIRRAKRAATRRLSYYRLDSLLDESAVALDDVGDEEHEAVVAEVNFREFLTLMMLVQRINREEQRSETQEIFSSYDVNNKGRIQIKDITGLFRALGLQPKTREEQLEIRAIWDEVDEHGDGAFNFQEFELLVHRMRERLERHERREEERFALDLGLPLRRCRELRDIFREHLGPGCTELSVPELRQVVESLHLRYTSEELISLYHSFEREDRGGIDYKGFMRMMHAIEVAQTHGSVRKARLAHRLLAASPLTLPPPKASSPDS